MSDWRALLGKHLRLSAAATDELLDAARRKLSARLRTNQPQCICAYRGYATHMHARLSGRVLANRMPAELGDTDSVWRNLFNTYRRFETDEVPDVPVTVRFEDRELTVRTDEEGYYQCDIPRQAEGAAFWLKAQASCDAEGERITAAHSLVAPGPDAEFGVISDLDDTIIETNVSSLLTAAKLTFVGNAKTRKPLEGVAALYQSFLNGHAGRPVNPIFYISSSPWNLYDLLRDFLELNQVPNGPIFLRDLGIDRTKFVSPSGHREKLKRAAQIMADFPELPFVLVGDSAQQDAHLYAEAATLLPGRIKAIYIRDVDPKTASARDEFVREHIKTAQQHHVPMLLVPESLAIAQHAAELGLIPAHKKPEVATEVAKDQQRPDPGAKAIAEALGV